MPCARYYFTLKKHPLQDAFQFYFDDVNCNLFQVIIELLLVSVLSIPVTTLNLVDCIKQCFNFKVGVNCLCNTLTFMSNNLLDHASLGN